MVGRCLAAVLLVGEFFDYARPAAGEYNEAAALAACRCDFGEDPDWRAFTELAQRCWDVGHKIPPELYTAASNLRRAIQERAQLEEELLLAGQETPPWDCAPGAFVALFVLLVLWEAHDAPEDLLDTALVPALALRARHLAPAAVAEGVLDCRPAAAANPGRAWPGVLRLEEFDRLDRRLSRKSAARNALDSSGKEAWHFREQEEHERRTAVGELRPLGGLCLCLLHGEGAQTLNATLESYRAGGLLRLARRRLMAFLEPRGGEPAPPEVDCWRERTARRYDFEVLSTAARDWPDPFIGGRHRRGSPGAAMAACAAACSEEHILFLEDDWELVTRPPELVRHRLRMAMEVLSEGEATEGTSSSSSAGAPLLGVHLRHKLFFGAPFYELVTAAQHNEPPSPYTAWYFSEDPVRDRFPDGLWAPPFWDSQGPCDSQRRSWRTALGYQLAAAREGERRSRGESGPPEDSDDSPSRVWWCSNGSSLLCTSTAAHRDPFRSLMYSTNPTLYRTSVWQLYIASHAAVLQDLRAVEESLSASYMWRVQPSFTLALSLGLFRHRRLDRRQMPPPEEDRDAAICMGVASISGAFAG